MSKLTISLIATYISGFELELTIVKSFVMNIQNGLQAHHYPRPRESAIMGFTQEQLPTREITTDRVWRSKAAPHFVI